MSPDAYFRNTNQVQIGERYSKRTSSILGQTGKNHRALSRKNLGTSVQTVLTAPSVLARISQVVMSKRASQSVSKTTEVTAAD